MKNVNKTTKSQVESGQRARAMPLSCCSSATRRVESEREKLSSLTIIADAMNIQALLQAGSEQKKKYSRDKFVHYVKILSVVSCRLRPDSRKKKVLRQRRRQAAFQCWPFNGEVQLRKFPLSEEIKVLLFFVGDRVAFN